MALRPGRRQPHFFFQRTPFFSQCPVAFGAGLVTRNQPLSQSLVLSMFDKVDHRLGEESL
ncbi:MAG: hypothetical protein CVU38_12865 [Chloroflexi bacterium HGW-Chloroflexi-1]|nr:MAG: hypothetical protein CVU38_12865 [Chloroflexi bacterium HGW-Chloroflexi-1]